jgi:hypothetical protein
MIIARESFYNALFTNFLVPLLAPGGTVGGPTDGQSPGTPTSGRPFSIVSREVIEVQRVPPSLQPVLFMDEAIEEYIDQGPGLTKFVATVYFHIGCTSTKGTPVAPILNPLLDVLEDALNPSGGLEVFQLALGDRIERAQLKGMSVKELGQNSTRTDARQAAAYVPFEIVVA